MEISKKNFMTATQKRRQQRNIEIVNDYNSMKSSAAPHRIMSVLADKYQMTLGTVRNILIEYKAYNPKSAKV